MFPNSCTVEAIGGVVKSADIEHEECYIISQNRELEAMILIIVIVDCSDAEVRIIEGRRDKNIFRSKSRTRLG
jgi:hypothetical protein